MVGAAGFKRENPESQNVAQQWCLPKRERRQALRNLYEVYKVAGEVAGG